jgi:hypothetical protein
VKCLGLVRILSAPQTCRDSYVCIDKQIYSLDTNKSMTRWRLVSLWTPLYRGSTSSVLV